MIGLMDFDEFGKRELVLTLLPARALQTERVCYHL